MVLEVPLWLQASTGDVPIAYTAAQFRGLLSALAVPGVTRKNDLLVSQRAGGANMSVDVAAGSCVIPGTSLSNQGYYWCRSTSVLNVTIAAAPPSGSRTDLIVAQCYDSQSDSSGLYSWTPLVVTGTVGSGAPAVPANAILLATVAVTSGQASVVTANITDKRVLNLLVDKPQWQIGGGDGTSIPTGTVTTYPATGFANRIGVDTNANPGEIVIRQPGQYSVSYTHRLDDGGTATADIECFVERLNSSGTVLERIGGQGQYPQRTSGARPVQTASGTAVCVAGDILRARSYQLSGVTLHLTNANLDLRFTGGLIGPS